MHQGEIMKYKIFGLDPDKIIKKYVIKNNHIVVIFLAGNKQVIPYTKDNELTVVNEMTKQALMRENDFFNDEIDIKSDIFGEIFSTTEILMYINFLNNIGDKMTASDMSNIILNCYYYFGIVGLSFYSLLAVVGVISIIKKNKKIEDNIKYRLYLSMKQELEQYKDLILPNGLNLKDRLNINTLDSLSSSELRKILSYVSSQIEENKMNQEKNLLYNTEKHF